VSNFTAHPAKNAIGSTKKFMFVNLKFTIKNALVNENVDCIEENKAEILLHH